MYIEDNSYLTVIIANSAQQIMADHVIAWYGLENIDKIIPGNEIFIEVHFKDGTTRSFFCGMYLPELMERDENRDHDKRLDTYYRRFSVYADADKKLEAEDKVEDTQIEEPEHIKRRNVRK